jgi:hypothetical protein
MRRTLLILLAVLVLLSLMGCSRGWLLDIIKPGTEEGNDLSASKLVVSCATCEVLQSGYRGQAPLSVHVSIVIPSGLKNVGADVDFGDGFISRDALEVEHTYENPRLEPFKLKAVVYKGNEYVELSTLIIVVPSPAAELRQLLAKCGPAEGCNSGTLEIYLVGFNEPGSKVTIEVLLKPNAPLYGINFDLEMPDLRPGTMGVTCTPGSAGRLASCLTWGQKGQPNCPAFYQCSSVSWVSSQQILSWRNAQKSWQFHGTLWPSSSSAEDFNIFFDVPLSGR